ncbi:MAG: enoyl-CoA hydratase [SAR324 cluster bacterium]|uniref:Enoyl-CoA hydratase n=1 Tax=SAR324 cluster bacterium TaxID=2024889 RepID=A0A2A4T3Y6_9DELT|nr:MAG: enoyl-CoA hydratase [SAR324 cluster bacterium]
MKMPNLTDASLSLDQGVAILTFQRHDVRNALTGTELIDDIVNTVEWANENKEVLVLVFTGEGSAFSAGGNIKEMKDRKGTFGGSAAEIEEKYRRGIQRIPIAMHKAEVPTIAAVNGAAIGAGFDLANMCDMRIGSTKSLFGETFINLGIIPGDGGAWFLQRLIGYQKAAEITLTGRLIKADEAKELGILLDVVEPDQLMERVNELARQIASKPPHAIRYTKRLLKLAQREELSDFLELCACFQGMSHQKADHLEAVNAFLEKREPNFQGK